MKPNEYLITVTYADDSIVEYKERSFTTQDALSNVVNNELPFGRTKAVKSITIEIL